MAYNPCMATQIFQIDTDPTDVITAVDPDLEEGKRYNGRFIGNGDNYLYVLETAVGSPPSAGDLVTPYRNFEDIGIVPASGEGIFLWMSKGLGTLYIDEVA